MAGNAQNNRRPLAEIPADRRAPTSFTRPHPNSPLGRLYKAIQKAKASVWQNARECVWALGFGKPAQPVDPVPTRAGARKEENPEPVKDKKPIGETGQKSQRAQRDEFGLWYAWPHPYPGDDWRGYDAAYYGLYPATCDAVADILVRLECFEMDRSQATLLIAEAIRKQGPFVGARRPAEKPDVATHSFDGCISPDRALALGIWTEYQAARFDAGLRQNASK